MGRWVEHHSQVSDVQIKIALLVLGSIVVVATILMFYSYSISR
jgi:hypothetical protein